MRVLVVEDEKHVSSLLQKVLRREGYSVDTASTGQQGLGLAAENDYDAILLDLAIPAPDGFEVSRRLRTRGRWAPIMVVSGRTGVDDRVKALDAGADDYLAKPFSVAELTARLRALIRRGAPERPPVLSVGVVALDPSRHEVRVGDTPVALTAKEFSLLELLMRHQGRTLSRSFILDHVWDANYEAGSNVVDVYVRYLRDKIDRPFGLRLIQSVRGVGYRMEEPRPSTHRSLPA